MADNNNFSGHYGNMADYAAREAEQAEREKQARSTTAVLATTSAAVHSSFNNLPTDVEGGTLTPVEKFNMIIGVMLLYGFAVNAILCFVLKDFIIEGLSPVAMMVIYIVGVIAGMVICRKAKSAVVGFIGYNLIVVPMGIFLTPLLSLYNIGTIRYEFCVMGVCMMLMIGLAHLYPQFFLSIGRMLLSCLIIGIVGELIMWCVGLSSGLFDFLFIGIFMAYIGYDWAMAQRVNKTTTNAICCAYMIYVDLINLLVRLLRILSKNRD